MFKQMLRARTKKVGRMPRTSSSSLTNLLATVRQRFMDAEGTTALSLHHALQRRALAMDLVGLSTFGRALRAAQPQAACASPLKQVSGKRISTEPESNQAVPPQSIICVRPPSTVQK